jgi:imidazolonepropionase-like amidohydrolase
VSKDCGTLEAGKYADVISVDGDPLEDIWAMARPRFLMKAGARFDHLSIF